ncbi:MAG: UDP-galactopyranose mutase [Lachnospiraceae bacterium]|nr:UDP-galactopyranose mutase [Lachnospiraceae bacterium]
MKYDYLIVGAGLYGSVFAHEAKKAGKTCFVIDKRPNIGGNIYTERKNGIDVHKYGAHIFHTSDKEIWDYVNQFADFNNYVNSPVAVYKDELYNLPFNMNTFSKMWNIKTPKEAEEIIKNQIADLNITDPANLEEQALSLVGTDVYEKLIKGYTEKQWGKDCKDLPSFIIKRLPLRFTFDNNYFNDRYQGIPIGGYTKIIEGMLEGIEVRCNEDWIELYKENKINDNDNSKPAKITLSDGTSFEFEKMIYTGQIDEYFNYLYGHLEYRSVRFETEEVDTDNYQGNAVVNYTEREVPYTRIIEHKWFNFGKDENGEPIKGTIISKEYSSAWKIGDEPYYPVNTEKNNKTYEKYKELSKSNKRVIFGGRLGLYKYLDMDKVIAEALKLAKEELK